jgi:GNAT superfamily N-acetyltransferase
MTQVTTFYLDMGAAAELRPRRSPDPRFAVREVSPPQWEVNRSMYLLVGGAWEWTDRCNWSDAEWRAYVGSAGLRTFVASVGEDVAGYYELSREPSGDVEIVYFGLMPQFFGHGLGGALLTDALERAWGWDARRVWVHTCTLDHPAALKNYEARGMRVRESRLHDALEGPGEPPAHWG